MSSGDKVGVVHELMTDVEVMKLVLSGIIVKAVIGGDSWYSTNIEIHSPMSRSKLMRLRWMPLSVLDTLDYKKLDSIPEEMWRTFEKSKPQPKEIESDGESKKEES